VRALVNSRFKVIAAAATEVEAASSAPAAVSATNEQPLVAGPPLRTAIEDAETNSLYLPVIGKW
jgi:hypothetical protein